MLRPGLHPTPPNLDPTMDVRLILGSLLLLCATAAAQVATPKPAPAPNAPVTQTPAPQDPAKPQDPPAVDKDKPVQTPADLITELTRERDRLQTEIEYAKNRAKGANKMLAEKLGVRGQAFKNIDAGTSASAPAPVAPMSKARLMTPAELESQPKDVMFLLSVQGKPGYAVRQTQYDELMQYLASSPASGNDEIRAQRVMFDLIRTFSVVAAFPENAAEGQIADIYGELESGKKMADIVKTYGVVQGAKEDGSIEVTRNSYLGTKVEQVAFSLQPGQRSRPFHGPQGMMVLEVDSAEKGATPDLDKLMARIVLSSYQADPATLQKAQSAAVSGQVDIAVRDQQVMDLLPALFKPVPGGSSSGANVVQEVDSQIATMLDSLKQLDAAIAKVRTMDTPEAKSQLEALIQQRAQVQTAIDEMQKKDADGTDGDKAVVPDATPVPVKKDIPIKKGA